ncbi:hypothetical protein, partial [Proteus terrae]|uniref:hypothetical protein n=1 Tax=Proteus terrae TaxID=1574161 RepID=UPI001CBB1988
AFFQLNLWHVKSSRLWIRSGTPLRQITSEGQYFTHLQLISQVYNSDCNILTHIKGSFDDCFRLGNFL